MYDPCSGDIVHLKVLGQRMIVLNTVKAARDLLDKRSSVYSDRPPFVMGDLCVSRSYYSCMADKEYPHPVA